MTKDELEYYTFLKRNVSRDKMIDMVIKGITATGFNLSAEQSKAMLSMAIEYGIRLEQLDSWLASGFLDRECYSELRKEDVIDKCVWENRNSNR